jgi:hypothetical protein
LLKDFCHHYQIPFLENNVPKSCRNAAKIYYRLREDAKKPNHKYDSVVEYLESIPKDEVIDFFNPFKLKEKWLKFFRSGF